MLKRWSVETLKIETWNLKPLTLNLGDGFDYDNDYDYGDDRWILNLEPWTLNFELNAEA